METVICECGGVKFEDNGTNHRTYHLRVPVRKSCFWDAGSGTHPFISDREAKGPLVDGMKSLRGLQGFYLHDGYELKAQKATSYGWDELHSNILALVVTHNATAEWPDYDEEPETIAEAVLTGGEDEY